MTDYGLDPYFLDRAKAKRGGRLNAYETLDPRRTALVVVDMQDFYIGDDMPSRLQSGQKIVGNINRLAKAVRDAGGHVVWITTTATGEPEDWANRAEATSEEGWARRLELLAPDGAGAGLFAECDARDTDSFAVKTRYSAFIPYPSGLSEVLHKNGIETVLIAGVATSTCCESTGRDACQWGYRTIMVADGNADQTDELHRHTLGKFLCNFGDVQSTDQLVEKLLGAG